MAKLQLKVASRRRRVYLLRIAYPLIFAVVLACVWVPNMPSWSGSPAYRSARLAEFGKVLAVAITVFQFVALQLLAVLLVSTAMSEEIDRRTLGTLLTTPITGLQIAGGKLASRLLQVLFFLGISVPILVLMRVFGGVPWEFVVAGTCITLTSVIFVGSVTMAVSLCARRLFSVIALTIFALGFFYVLVPWGWCALWCRLDQAPIDSTATLVSPTLMLAGTAERLLAPQWGRAFHSWAIHCAIFTCASAGMLAICASSVSRIASFGPIGSALGQRVLRRLRGLWPTASPVTPAPIRFVWGPPVLWRELGKPFIHGKSARRAAVAAVAAAVLAAYFARHDLLDYPHFHADLLTAFVVLGMLVTAVAAGGAIAGEKETRTWPMLLGTSQTEKRIIFDKFLGCLRRSLPVWSLVALHLLVFLPTGLVAPFVFPLVACVVAGVACLLAGLGLYFGTRLRTTVSAVTATVLTALALWAVAPGILSLAVASRVPTRPVRRSCSFPIP